MAKNKNGKRTDQQREYDLELASDLYLKCTRQIDIALAINERSKLLYRDKAYVIGQSQISDDLALIRKRWLESQMFNMNEYFHRELAKLDLIESEAWAAWERSKLSFTSDSKRKYIDKEGVERIETTNKVEQRDGNAKFMELSLNVIKERRALIECMRPAAESQKDVVFVIERVQKKKYNQ
jgi:hypothetical protein